MHECVHFCIFVFGSMHDAACAIRLAERILSRLHQNFAHYFKAHFAIIIFGNQCVKKYACCNQSDCPLWQILHSPALFSILLRCYQARGCLTPCRLLVCSQARKENNYLVPYTHPLYAFACFCSIHECFQLVSIQTPTDVRRGKDWFLVDRELNAWSRKSLFPYLFHGY